MTALPQPPAVSILDAQGVLGYLLSAPRGDVATIRDILPVDAMPLRDYQNALTAIYDLGAGADIFNVHAWCAARGLEAPALAELMEWSTILGPAMSDDGFIDAARRIHTAHRQRIAAESIYQAAEAIERGMDARKVLQTLAEAAGATPSSLQHPRFIIRTEADLAELPPPSWLLPDELLRGGFHLVYGASGSGKTFYALDRALRAASAGARCLYIATEDLAGLKLRVAAWRYFYPDAAGRLAWLEMPEGLDLGSSAHLGELLAALHGLDLDLITIDTLREAHTGDENSSQDMAAVNRAVQRIIRETGAAVDLVHHSGVNEGRERGSTALGANCDLKWKVTVENDRIAISCEKYRHGPLFTPRYYRITPVQGVESGAVLLPAALTTNRGDSPLTAAERKVLELLALSIFEELGAKTTQIAEGAGVSQATLYRVLSTLKRRGYLTQGSKGDPYRITAAGRAQLGPEYAPAPAGTLSEDDASDSATITTLNQLSGTLSDSVSTHSSLSLTLTTPRGESERESRGSGWGEMRGDPTEYAKREQEAAAIPPAIERWAAEHTPRAWEELKRACGSLCYPQQALERAGVPLLPPGWQLKKCDTKGHVSRYGIRSVAIGPDGQRTEVHEYEHWTICAAWQLAEHAERPAAAD